MEKDNQTQNTQKQTQNQAQPVSQEVQARKLEMLMAAMREMLDADEDED